MNERPWNFDDLEVCFNHHYSLNHQLYGYPADRAYARLTGLTTTVSQYIRRTRDVSQISDLLCRTFMAVAEIADGIQYRDVDFSIQKALVAKWGEGCAHCKNVICTCVSDFQPTDAQLETALNLQQAVARPRTTINTWQKYADVMYGHVNFPEDKDVWDSMVEQRRTMLEESGELAASAYPDINGNLQTVSFQDGLNPVVSELGDTIFHGFKLANGLDRITGDYQLGTALQKMYENGCPDCASPLLCICDRVETFGEKNTQQYDRTRQLFSGYRLSWEIIRKFREKSGDDFEF